MLEICGLISVAGGALLLLGDPGSAGNLDILAELLLLGPAILLCNGRRGNNG